MKRFRWWILAAALLLLAGLILVLAWPKREPLDVTFIGRGKDAFGKECIVVWLTNHSEHAFEVLAGTQEFRQEWDFVAGGNIVFPTGQEGHAMRFLKPRTAEHFDLPAPTQKAKWRLYLFASRQRSRMERRVDRCFALLKLKRPNRELEIEKIFDIVE